MLIACQDALRMPDARLTGPRQGRAIRNANGKRGGAPLYIAAAAAPRRRRSAFRLFGFAAAATTFPHRFVTFRLGGNVILIVESTLARSECNKTEVFCGAAGATNDFSVHSRRGGGDARRRRRRRASAATRPRFGDRDPLIGRSGLAGSSRE